LRLGLYAGMAALVGFGLGVFADGQVGGPVPWAFVLPVAFGVGSMAWGYMLTQGGGMVAATLHNPSGKSTPAKKQYSAAQALLARGHYEDAIAAYQHAISEDASDPTPYLQVARILRDELERYEESASWFRQVHEHPNASSGISLLALREITELYTQKLGQPQKALPLLARLSETQPDSPEGEWATRELVELKRLVFGEPGP
jgi:hypothetical protein